jgi:hypothetical protein
MVDLSRFNPFGSDSGEDDEDDGGDTGDEGAALTEADVERMESTVVISADPTTDYEELIDRLRNRDLRNINGVVIEARVGRSSPDRLRGLRNEVHHAYRFPDIMLVAVEENRRALREAAEPFDTTIAVSPANEEKIEYLRPHYTEFLRHARRFGKIGSARVRPVEKGSRLEVAHDLRRELGQELHEFGNATYPEFYAFRAPGTYANVANDVLREMGWVVSSIHADGGEIQVVGLVFDLDEADLPDEGRHEPLGRSDPNHVPVDGQLPGGTNGRNVGAAHNPDEEPVDRVIRRNLNDS